MKRVLLVAIVAACSSGRAAPVPPPTIVDVAGLRKVLDAQKGHPVVVNVWASWCGPCMEEFPDVVAGAQTWRKRGVRFVSLSADDARDVGKVRKVLERYGAPFDAILMADEKAGPQIIDSLDPDWSGALPTSFLLDARGKRLERRTGAISAKLLEKWLAPLTGDKK